MRRGRERDECAHGGARLVGRVDELDAAVAVGRLGEVEDAARDVARDRVLGHDAQADPLEHARGAREAHGAGGVRARGGLAAPHVLEALDGVEGVLERHAVGKRADALLEELDRGLGVDAEAAVGLSAREAQDVQALLELAHIVAVEVGEPQVERAVSELVALVHERGPRGGVHRLAEAELVVEAEARDGGGGGAAKRLAGELALVDAVAERLQPLLDVLDRGALGAFLNGFHKSLS